ncbi:MAG: glycosyltransferase [Pseudomonadota bacterium]
MRSDTGALPPLVLDITRSLRRAHISRPSGIDRVESAYLAWALRRPGGAWLLAGLGRDPDGQGPRQIALVPPAAAPRLAAGLACPSDEALDLRARLSPWRDPSQRAAEAAVRRAATAIIAPRPGALAQVLPRPALYLNTGHENLSEVLLAALGAVGIRRIVLLHDLIPITHPAFTVPAAGRRFRTRLAAALMADLHLYNSAATGRGVAAWAAEQGRRPPPGRVLPLGIPAPRPTDPHTLALPPSAGHFVQLGTIEGRKNHLLTLTLWRGLSEQGPPETLPHLHIVGRRGWAADQVFEMLDRSPARGRTVFEYPAADDATVAALLAGARALLFPSFAEGYGLPLGEALAAGTPAIAADLPALRELGGDVPDWLDPADGAAWLRAIRAYTPEGSPERNAQIARMVDWERPSWEAHFAQLETVLASAEGAPGGGQGGWAR